MASELVVVAVFLGGISFSALLVWLIQKHGERAHRNVAQLARQLGLQLGPATKRFGFWPEPRAAGQFRGRQAELYTFTTGSGKSRVRWSALAVTPTATGGLTFRLTRQGLGSKLSEWFGAKEITVGDRAFDDAWFIQTNHADFFRAALIPELRARLTAVSDTSGRAHRASLKLDGNAVVYAEAGEFGDERLCARLAGMAEALSDFADVAEVFAQTQRRPES